MQLESNNNLSDLTFIGSGISASFTILHFLESLTAGNESKGKIRIHIIDKYGKFHTGIPYGARSGSSVHLITSLKNFLPEPELCKFISWLNQNKSRLLEELQRDGGVLSKEWLDTHTGKIENNDWEDLFIPRRFFGRYITEKVKKALQESERKGWLDVQYVTAEVVDLHKSNGIYAISLKDNQTILSEKVVLSVGSLPVNHLWREKDLVEEEKLLFVNDPYKLELNTTLKRIQGFSQKLASDKKLTVLVVGANASGLEMMYKLNDIEGIQSQIGKFIFLSTQGLLPDAVIDEGGRKKYVPENLQALTGAKDLTAKDIAEAAYRDLDAADEIGLGAASTVEIISKAFGSLLGKLNHKELKEFACVHGNEIGRRQRCAGFHYSKTIDKLKEENRFDHIAGRFINIHKGNTKEYSLEYLDTASGTHKIYGDEVHVIINCIGSTNLSRENVPDLLKNLMDKGYCRPNESKIGFEVNEALETKENLHVVGPLLAGNIFEGKGVWHVEHCGRIIWLSKVLSKEINNHFFKKITIEGKS